LVQKKGELLFEKYYPGKDEAWGTDLGIVQHSRDSLHDLRSMSKSIVALCVGLAIEQGLIQSVDQKVKDFFPEIRQSEEELYAHLTLEHLLTMTSGLEWNEDVPYDDPSNSETQMIWSEEPVRFVLNQPIVNIPGEVWAYNGGTTEVLAAIIKKKSGLSIDEFANKYLFNPLGIETYYWARSPFNNLPVAASGLRLTPLDQLKIGELLLNNGFYGGKQIIDPDWISESFKPHIKRGESGWYGYQFWIDHSPINNISFLIAAVGNGNQRLYLDLENELVVGINSGNYNLWNIENGPYSLLVNYIYPAINICR